MISACGHFERDRNKKVQQPDKKGIHEAGDHHNGKHGKRAGDHQFKAILVYFKHLFFDYIFLYHVVSDFFHHIMEQCYDTPSA